MASRGKSVLVVDDDATIRKLEVFLLQREGYDVMEAGGGTEAIEEIDRTHPDLVLLDLLMPGVGGWDVLDHVVRGHDRPRVVVVTGAVADAPAHLQPFVDAVVAKPFDPMELVGVCNRLTSASSAPRRPLLR